MVTQTRFRVGEWWVDPALDEISRAGPTTKLEPRMMRLLLRLAENPGQVVSTQELLDSVWSGVVVGPASVYQAVSQLRKLLGDTDSTPTYIQTVQRKGYRLIAEVAPAREAEGIPPAPTAPPARGAAPRRFGRIALIGALVLVAGALILYALRESRLAERTVATSTTGASAASTPEALAVLMFASANRDDALTFSVTDLLRNQLAKTPDLVVISTSSTTKLAGEEFDAAVIGKKLHARYLVAGAAARNDQEIRIDVRLVDSHSGAELWSKTLARPEKDFASMIAEIASEVGGALKIRLEAPAVNSPVDPDVYQLYVRGQRAMSGLKDEDIALAKALFTRSISMDPEFARGHVGFGQTLVQEAIKQGWKQDAFVAAVGAFDRALQLDPTLGEAWIGRARCATTNLEQAEEMYRKGLRLAPNDDDGFKQYAYFLMTRSRVEEAIAMIDKASAIDPLSPLVSRLRAGFRGNKERNSEDQERILREALEADPNDASALISLAVTRAFGAQELAEGIKLGETALKMDPHLEGGVMVLSVMYVNLDDFAAASDVVGASPGMLGARVANALFQGKTTEAAALAMSTPVDQLPWQSNDLPTFAAAIRDAAVQDGRYEQAVERIGSMYAFSLSSLPEARRGVGLIYAHVLVLAGEKQRGIALARSLLDELDSQKSSQVEAVERHGILAQMHAMLGENEKALSELVAAQQRAVGLSRYTAELDPLYVNLRSDPRFKSLAELGRLYRARQRALLEEMRRKGEVPRRPASP